MNSAIPAFLLLALAVLWWLSAVNARERARQVVGRFCKSNGWQLLDQTVALRSMRPARTDHGWNLYRNYRFDFSPDGGRRFGGEIHFAGARALRILAQTEDGRIIEDFVKKTGSPDG